MVVGLVAEIFAGTGIREPVTTTSCSVASGATVAAGACCAMAGTDMASAHAHIAKVIVIRFTSDRQPISLRNLIVFSLVKLYVAACLQVRKLPLCYRDMQNTNERRSDWVDDSRPPTDEYENGMNVARSVMKAAG